MQTLPITKALVRDLGLYRVEDLLAGEVRRVQVEVLREGRDVIAGMIARLDERLRAVG